MLLRSRSTGILLPFLAFSLLLAVPTFIYLSLQASGPPVDDSLTSVNANKLFQVGDEVSGDVIMPKLGNATVKAELGRASWKLLHTMAQRYPEHPTADEKSAFRSFIYLFSRLYPCGECAAHFQLLLKDFPPQTSSQKTASMWLCGIHNKVNARLGKEEFDCTQLEGLYDCGCGDESKPAERATDEEPARKDELTGEALMPGRV